MERKDLLKIIVLVGAAVMVGSMFAPMLFFGPSGNTGTSGQMITAIGEFNGTIRTYDPFLEIVGQIQDKDKSDLLLDARVTGIAPSASGYLINLSTRDDVYPVAEYLRKKGVETVAVANIIPPASIRMKLANGSTMDVVSTINVRIAGKPMVDADSEVLVKIVGYVQDGRLVYVQTGSILAENISLAANGTVVSIKGREYEFTIPWEDRVLDESAINGGVSYDRNDYISFPSGLSVLQITEKKGLAYISFISDTGASVSENFTNRTRVLEDFANISVVFPDSVLKITTNSSVNLPYNSTLEYGYVVALPPKIDGYSLDDESMDMSLEEEYQLNDTVELTISGQAIGKRIVEIDSIKAG